MVTRSKRFSCFSTAGGKMLDVDSALKLDIWRSTVLAGALLSCF